MKTLLTAIALMTLCLGCKEEPKTQVYGYALEQQRLNAMTKEERQSEQLRKDITTAILDAEREKRDAEQREKTEALIREAKALSK